MYLLRAVSSLALSVAVAFPVMSQSLSQLGGPAELPPASYSADQYVDSRGCVFIRAGYGGQETWVPRVTRDRQPLCGYQPSIAGAVAAAEPAPTPEPPSAPAEAPVVIAAAPAAASPAPRPVAAAPAAAAPAAPASTPVRTASSCQGLPGNAAQYMQGSDVRCGPQAHHPSGGAAMAVASATGGAPQLQLEPVVIPEGYRRAWDDGRLNAARGLPYATPEGDAAMAAIWSDTVPRVAIDPAADGVPVTYSASGVVVTRASSTPEIAVGDAPEPATAPVTISIPAGHRYVEIARYTSRENADAARLQLQRQGLPTQLGGIQRDGAFQTFVVLAGPYDDPQTLARTLGQAQGLGYSGAVTR